MEQRFVSPSEGGHDDGAQGLTEMQMIKVDPSDGVMDAASSKFKEALLRSNIIDKPSFGKPIFGLLQAAANDIHMAFLQYLRARGVYVQPSLMENIFFEMQREKSESSIPAWEPVGLLAATAVSNPTYRVFLDDSEETKTLLLKVSLRDAAVVFLIKYKSPVFSSSESCNIMKVLLDASCISMDSIFDFMGYMFGSERSSFFEESNSEQKWKLLVKYMMAVVNHKHPGLLDAAVVEGDFKIAGMTLTKINQHTSKRTLIEEEDQEIVDHGAPQPVQEIVFLGSERSSFFEESNSEQIWKLLVKYMMTVVNHKHPGLDAAVVKGDFKIAGVKVTKINQHTSKCTLVEEEDQENVDHCAHPQPVQETAQQNESNGINLGGSMTAADSGVPPMTTVVEADSGVPPMTTVVETAQQSEKNDIGRQSGELEVNLR